MKTIVWRALNAFMALIFLVAVYVQYNDPDPLLWMILYAIPMILALTAAFGINSRLAPPAAAAYLLFAVWQMPWGKLNEALFIRPTWHMVSQDNEYAREAVGLLICAAWMVVLAIARLLEQRKFRNLDPSAE